MGAGPTLSLCMAICLMPSASGPRCTGLGYLLKHVCKLSDTCALASHANRTADRSPHGDPEWFVHCDQAQICLLLVSAQFLHSSWCEGQLTYAKGG